MDLGLSLVLMALGTIAFFLLVKRKTGRFGSRLPPGPWGLPLVGYPLILESSNFKNLLKLREKYGDVIGFYQGSQYTVVLNNFFHIKEAFNKEEFSDRPCCWFKISEDTCNLAEMSGSSWKIWRSIVAKSMKNCVTSNQETEAIIQEEINSMIDFLKTRDPGAETNVTLLLAEHLTNIILILTCGRNKRHVVDMWKTVERFTQEFRIYVTAQKEDVCYPYLKYFKYFKNFGNAVNLNDTMKLGAYLRNETYRHEKEETSVYGSKGIITSFLEATKHNNSENSVLRRPNIVGNVQILMFGATDTTRIAMSWVFMFLSKHQREQDRIYQEISDVFGKDVAPSWNEKDKLPYTNAFIMEVARYTTVSPSSDPHWSSKEGTVGGYRIPKNTMLVANVAAVHSDPMLWGDPEVFRPERFLSEDEQRIVTPEYWIPFLTGKRRCPGQVLAKILLFLFATSVVQKFQVLPASSEFSLQEKDIMVIVPEHPLICFKARQ